MLEHYANRPYKIHKRKPNPLGLGVCQLLTITNRNTGVTMKITLETCDPKYGICDRCGQKVQLNKFLFGSLHICNENSWAAMVHRTRKDAIKKQAAGYTAASTAELMSTLGGGSCLKTGVISSQKK